MKINLIIVGIICSHFGNVWQCFKFVLFTIIIVLKCYNIYTLSKDLLAIQVECEVFLDDKQMIKFDLSEDQIMTFVCAIYKKIGLFSRTYFELDVENVLQPQKNNVFLF